VLTKICVETLGKDRKEAQAQCVRYVYRLSESNEHVKTWIARNKQDFQPVLDHPAFSDRDPIAPTAPNTGNIPRSPTSFATRLITTTRQTTHLRGKHHK